MHDTTTPAALDSVATRRCWRCLQMFPGDDANGSPVRTEFWLCDQCETVLLPSKQRAS